MAIDCELSVVGRGPKLLGCEFSVVGRGPKPLDCEFSVVGRGPMLLGREPLSQAEDLDAAKCLSTRTAILASLHFILQISHFSNSYFNPSFGQLIFIV